MFELYISLIIFCISLKLIYNKYFRKNYKEGEWLLVNKDLESKYFLNWDVSKNSCIRIANFSKFKKYFFGKDLYQKLKPDSGILMTFNQKNLILDVYDENMINIYHLIDPDFLIFSTIKKDNHYELESNKKYIFFVRSKEKDFKYKLQKYKNISKIDFNIKINNQVIHTVNEEELYEEFAKMCIEIRDSMSKKNFSLVDIVKSEEYVSYPSNNIANKLSINSNSGDVLILVCTNKGKTSCMKNHVIEINSSNNSFEWKPDNDENICHLMLENFDVSGEVTFYERTTNISNGSNILNFNVMVFSSNY